MKCCRYIYLSVLLVGLTAPCSSFGQGTFEGTFYPRNYSLPSVNAPVFDSDGDRLFGPNYVAMLYGGLAIDSLTPALD